MSGRKLSLLWIFVLLCSSGRALAAVRTWPGSAPCEGGLQACIDGASAGDVILLSGDVPAGTAITIAKSLTVKPYPGTAPLVAADFEVTEGPAGETVDVSLLQLHFSAAAVEVNFQTGSGHSFTLADSIVDADVDFHNGVQLYTKTQSRFTIERNSISARYWWGISYVSEVPVDVTNRVEIRQNRITTPDPTNSFGGIYFLLKGEGATGSSVHSNLIYDVDGANGGAGIKIDAEGSSTNNVQIINNTIDDVNAGQGLYVTAPDAGATLYVFFYNNIVSNVAQNWIQLPAAQPYLDVFHNYNTWWMAGSAGYGGFPPGAQTAEQDPLYANPPLRNYVPGVFSPCLNSGTNSVASGIPFRDVLGYPRILGGTADRGAYERSADFLTSYLLFSDFFSDGALDPGYAYEEGVWSEDGANLLEASKQRASMRFSDSMQCGLCTIEVDVSLTGTRGKGVGGKIWVLLWYEDAKNYVDLLIKPSSGQILLREHVEGRIVGKGKATVSLGPLQTYSFKVRYDGTNLTAGRVSQSDISLPAKAAHSGRFGFRTKGTTGFLSQIVAYP